MSERISNKVKVYSLLFILIIFLYHCDARYFLHVSDELDVLGPVGLSFFFMSSGYFMYLGATKEKMKARSLKRIKTLLVPYLFWNGIFFVYFLVSDSYFRQQWYKTLISRLLFQPYNDVLWYLFTLFIFALLAWPCYCLMKKKSTSIVFLLLLTALIMVVCIFKAETVVYGIPYGWWLVKIMPYLPMYFFGGFLALHLNKISVKSFKQSWPFIIASILVVILKLRYDSILWLGWTLLFLAPIVMWLAIPEKIFSMNRLINVFCEPSFFIYEFQLMNFWIWEGVFLNRIDNVATYEIAVFVAALIFSYVVFYGLYFICPPLLKIATGFRSGNRC